SVASSEPSDSFMPVTAPEPSDMVVFSAGVRPRDQLARAAGLAVGERGGIAAATLDAETGFGRVHNAFKNDGTTALDVRATTSHGDISARSL
ncbi:hypothetical protein ACWC4J_40495, partial [Streptomyces sp. NPDC001356]